MSAPLLPSIARAVCPSPAFLDEIRCVVSGAKRQAKFDEKYGQKDLAKEWNKGRDKALHAMRIAADWLGVQTYLMVEHASLHGDPGDPMALKMYWNDLDAVGRLIRTVTGFRAARTGRRSLRAMAHLADGLLNTLVMHRISYPSRQRSSAVVSLLEQMARAAGINHRNGAFPTKDAFRKALAVAHKNRKQVAKK